MIYYSYKGDCCTKICLRQEYGQRKRLVKKKTVIYGIYAYMTVFLAWEKEFVW